MYLSCPSPQSQEFLCHWVPSMPQVCALCWSRNLISQVCKSTIEPKILTQLTMMLQCWNNPNIMVPSHSTLFFPMPPFTLYNMTVLCVLIFTWEYLTVSFCDIVWTSEITSDHFFEDWGAFPMNATPRHKRITNCQLHRHKSCAKRWDYPYTNDGIYPL